MNLLSRIAGGLCLAFFTTQLHAQPLSNADIYFNKLADCIYRAEGGTSTRWPYGIKIKVKNPRAVCIKVCKDAWSDFCLLGCKGDYLDYLSECYCPSVDDPVGNLNWRHNVHALMK